jgi:hypothetical protein
VRKQSIRPNPDLSKKIDRDTSGATLRGLCSSLLQLSLYATFQRKEQYQIPAFNNNGAPPHYHYRTRHLHLELRTRPMSRRGHARPQPQLHPGLQQPPVRRHGGEGQGQSGQRSQPQPQPRCRSGSPPPVTGHRTRNPAASGPGAKFGPPEHPPPPGPGPPGGERWPVHIRHFVQLAWLSTQPLLANPRPPVPLLETGCGDVANALELLTDI